MITVKTLLELKDHVGAEIGVSEWVLIDQAMIDRFAEVTGDKNWYHVDVPRAQRELPGGATIAHGLLTLSLVPGLNAEIVRTTHHGRALNYGFNKVRFPVPVNAGSRVRLRMSVQSAEPEKGGLMITRLYVMELEGSERPAMTAEMLTLVYEN